MLIYVECENTACLYCKEEREMHWICNLDKLWLGPWEGNNILECKSFEPRKENEKRG